MCSTHSRDEDHDFWDSTLSLAIFVYAAGDPTIRSVLYKSAATVERRRRKQVSVTRRQFLEQLVGHPVHQSSVLIHTTVCEERDGQRKPQPSPSSSQVNTSPVTIRQISQGYGFAVGKFSESLVSCLKH